MENNEKRQAISDIMVACQDYLQYTAEYNECAFTDRMVEEILEGAEKLREIYNTEFDNLGR